MKDSLKKNIQKDETEEEISLISKDSSISFLEIPWCIQQASKKNEVEKEPEYENKESLITTDPLLFEYEFEFSKKLKHIVNKIEPKNFRFSFTDKDVVSINDYQSKTVILEIPVEDYEYATFSSSFKRKLIFVINKNKFKKKINKKENLKYKNAVIKKEKYNKEGNLLKDKDLYFLECQVLYKTNYIYIDESSDLLRELKNIVKNLKSSKVYVPKVKNYNESMKREFLENILCNIPGIGKTVGEVLSNKFLSFNNFLNFLSVDENNTLEEIMVWNEEKTCYRKLGQKQASLIRKCMLTKENIGF